MTKIVDMNANFTMQNGEWVVISAFFLLLPHLIHKDKTAFQPSLFPKGTLLSVLNVKIANYMPAYQFKPTKDLLKSVKLAKWKCNFKKNFMAHFYH